MRDKSEARLVEEAIEGSREAFDRLAGCYRPAMQTLAARLLGDPHEAEDRVQEALTNAFRGLSRLKEPAKFGAWLSSIVLNECRQHLRRGTPLALPLPEQLEVDRSEGQGARHLGGVLAQTAMRILQLPPSQSVAAAWFYFHGASYREVADAFGTTEAAVQSALQRARARIRAEESDIRSKGEHVMQDHQTDMEHVVSTPELVIRDLSLSDHRWGENQFSARVENPSDSKAFLGLDTRTCVETAGNWQTQWSYEVQPRGALAISETYQVFRILCPWYAIFRGPGVARIRVTFARLSEEQFREGSGFILHHSAQFVFRKWFEVIVPADSQTAGVPVKPIMPKPGDVTLEDALLGPVEPGEHTMKVVLRNHTSDARQVHLHVDAPWFGSGRSYSLDPKAATEAEVTYWVHEGATNSDATRDVVLHVVQLPLNMDDLDLADAGFFWVGYMEREPAATVAVERFALE